MAYSPVEVQFLAARNTINPDVCLLGIPLDLTETFRKGTAQAPDRIRLVSDCLETYSPILDRDLEDISLGDKGNIHLAGLDMPTALEAIETEVKELSKTTVPIILGGEHTLTLAAVRAMIEHHPNLAVVQIDAHLDLIEEYASLKISHATVMRRISEEIGWAPLVQLGVRSGTKAEFQAAKACRYSTSDVSMPPFVLEQLASRPVYVSIDIDVLDPACAPGTGCPEPGGPRFHELLNLIYLLKSLHIVAADIVEVCPNLDSADITSIAAAKLVRELALIIAAPH